MSIEWKHKWTPEFDRYFTGTDTIVKQGNVYYARVPSLQWLDHWRESMDLPVPWGNKDPEDPLYCHPAMKYAVLREFEPRVFYLDCEFEDELTRVDRNAYMVELSVVVGRVIDLLVLCRPENNRDCNPRMVISDASRACPDGVHFKYSHHIIIRGVGYFENHASMYQFSELLKAAVEVDDSFEVFARKCPIDFSVYSTNQAFRLVGNYKHNYRYNRETKEVELSEADITSRLTAVNERTHWLAHHPLWIGEDDTVPLVWDGPAVTRVMAPMDRVGTLDGIGSPVQDLEVQLNESVEDLGALEPVSFIDPISSLYNRPMVVTRLKPENNEQRYRLSTASQTTDLLGLCLAALPLNKVQSHDRYTHVLYIIYYELVKIYGEDRVFQSHATGFLARVRPNFTLAQRRERWDAVCHSAKNNIRGVYIGSLMQDDYLGKEMFNSMVSRLRTQRTHYCPIHQCDEPYCQAGLTIVNEFEVMQVYITCFNSKPPLTCSLGPLNGFEDHERIFSARYFSDEPAVLRQLWRYVSRPGTIEHGFFGHVDQTHDNQQHSWVFVSPMGTGKTTLLEKFFIKLPKDNRVLIMTNRTALSYALYEQFKDHYPSHHYKAMYTEENSSGYTSGLLLVQLDSLVKTLTNKGQIHPFDIVILEEFSSLLQYFRSETLQTAGKLGAILQAFEFVVSTARLVVVSDADYDEESRRVLRMLRESAKLEVYRNICYPLRRDFKIYLHPAPWQEILLHKVLDKGKKVFVATNSKSYAEGLYHLFQQRCHDEAFKIKLYTSNSSQADRQGVFNCNKEWEEYRVVITTPVIECGIDHTYRHFDYIFGYFTPSSSPPKQCIQMIGRVRNPLSSKVHVCLAVNSKSRARENIAQLPESFEAVHAHLTLNCHINYPAFTQPWLDPYGTWQLGPNTGFAREVAAGIRRIEHISSNRYINYFCKCIRKVGGTFEFIKDYKADMAEFDVGLGQMDEYRHRVILERAEKIARAPMLPMERVKAIASALTSRDIEVSEEDRYAFIRDRILHMLGLTRCHQDLNDTLFFVRYASPSQFASWLYLIGYQPDFIVELVPGTMSNVHFGDRMKRLIWQHFYFEADVQYFTDFTPQRCEFVIELFKEIGLDIFQLILRPTTLRKNQMKKAAEKLTTWLGNATHCVRMKTFFPNSINASMDRLRNNESRQQIADMRRALNGLMEPLTGCYYMPARDSIPANHMVVSSHLCVLQLLDPVFAMALAVRPYEDTYRGLQLALEAPRDEGENRALLLPEYMYTAWKKAQK